MDETATSQRQDTTKTPLGRIALEITRVLAAVLAVMILVQGALAGSFLSGVSQSLGIHEMLGTEVLTVLALVTVVAAVFGVRQKWWPLPVAVLGLVGIGTQIGMGFAGRLDIHVPLGIGLFGLYLTTALVLKPNDKRSKK